MTSRCSCVWRGVTGNSRHESLHSGGGRVCSTVCRADLASTAIINPGDVHGATMTHTTGTITPACTSETFPALQRMQVWGIHPLVHRAPLPDACASEYPLYHLTGTWNASGA